MYQMFYKVFFFVVVVAFVALPLQIDAKCESCGTNGIACINETSFYMCYDDSNADTSNIITCPDNKICTRSQMKCVDPGMGLEPDCTPNQGCGICDGSKMFTCTSRTTFAMCNGDELIDINGVCPPRLTCDSRNDEVCVNECKLPAKLECDREAPL